MNIKSHHNEHIQHVGGTRMPMCNFWRILFRIFFCYYEFIFYLVSRWNQHHPSTSASANARNWSSGGKISL